MRKSVSAERLAFEGLCAMMTPCPTVAAPELDRLFFPRSEGYLGGDSGLSVPLDRERILWVFGETLFGQISEGMRNVRAISHNTVAIQSVSDGIVPCRRFFNGERQGVPDAFFRLPGLHPEYWFWPGTAIVLEQGLFVFGYGVVREPGTCDPLNFRITDSWIIHILNPAEDPGAWDYVARPVFGHSGHAFYCSACWLQGDYVYLIGCSRDRSHDRSRSAAVLARIDAASLGDPASSPCMEYCVESGDRIRWSRQTGAVRELFSPGCSQSTIYYDAPRGRFLATTYTALTPELKLSWAADITGPWSKPVTVYHVDRHSPLDKYLTYAFRIHPHLSCDPDTLVLSYVINARRVADRDRETDIFYPRFLKMNLKASGGHGGPNPCAQ